MALRSPSSTHRRDLGPRDSPPADSPPLTCQGGSSNGAKVDVGRKKVEVDNLFVKLEKQGVEIDGKIASIIHDGMSKIKAEAVRENTSEPKRNWTKGGSGDGARADVATKTNEVEHLLADLERHGVEIDVKTASIIDDEVARIKAEAVRAKNIKGLKMKARMALLTISFFAMGFFLGEECYEHAVYARVARWVLFGEL